MRWPATVTGPAAGYLGGRIDREPAENGVGLQYYAFVSPVPRGWLHISSGASRRPTGGLSAVCVSSVIKFIVVPSSSRYPLGSSYSYIRQSVFRLEL